MIERVERIPYRLGLRQPWASARGSLGERQGWLVRIATPAHLGYGDCAPLPAAGTETPERALEALRRWDAMLVGRSPEEALADLDRVPEASPAARLAIECGLLDLLTRQRGETLRHRLAVASGDRVAVNAMLGALGPETPRRATKAYRDGFRVLKVKVGLDRPGAELSSLRALIDSLPSDAALRLDANGAWDLGDAKQVIMKTHGWPIEAIEEPLRRPRTADLEGLQALASFPLARDESLYPSLGDGVALPRQIPDPVSSGVRRWVLKPAAIGGLRDTLAWAECAVAAGLEVVITSVIESAAGIWPTLQLAAAIPPQPPHGLATSDWLIGDLGAAPVVEGGWIELPHRPGSGFEPCPSASARLDGDAGQAAPAALGR